MQTYQETVLRYRILRHQELPEAHKAEYRLHGIDPDHRWDLIYSYRHEQDALKCLSDCQQDAPKFYTYKMVDMGADQLIERPIW